MSRTKGLVTSLAILAALLTWAVPCPAPAGDDWLPISPEDLALKDNPASPGANAMILYRESAVDAKDSSVKEYVREKIFTQEGTKQADVEIQFVKGLDDIKDIRARTIRPDGSIVNFEGKPFEKVIVKAGRIKFLAKTFTLPDVQPGCVIEYKYRDQSDPDFFFNNRWIIQGSLFTRLARFSIRPYTGPNALALSYRSFGLPENTAPQKQNDGTYTLEIHNLPGIEEEDYMPPTKALRARVEFIYHDRNEPPNETTDQFWKRIGKNRGEDLDHFVNKKGALANDLARTISPSDPPETKLRKIYARVQQIRNLSIEESKTQKEEKAEKLKPNMSVEDVLKHGYATGREINFLFAGLARAAGFEATEVYVAPRNNNFFFPNLRDTSELGADIVWARVGTQEYYLDPAARYFPFGLLPWYEANTSGLRVNKGGGDFVTTPRPQASAATILRHAELEMDEEGLVTGKIHVDFTGQKGALRREENRDEDETGRRKALGDEIKGWLPAGSSFEVTNISNWDNSGEPLSVEGTVRALGFGTSAGRRMLVPVELFQAAEVKSFQPAKRVNEIDFYYPYEELDELKLRVPAGYKIETVPPVRKVSPGAVSYEISAAQQGDAVEVKRHLVIDGIMFSADAYPALRTFFNAVKSYDDTQIVLQNAESAKNN